ncbi:MAG: hypothetical protein AAGF56_00275 [Pseudomonadota bacterium]
MSARKTVTFYLHDTLRRQAERGHHNFIGKVRAVLQAAGFTIAYDSDDVAARLRARGRLGRALHLMDDPVNDRGLAFRKTYLYPFWHIEKQGTRWDWPVARAGFDPTAVDHRKSANFFRFWRKRLFDDAAIHARQDGFIFVPLQGQLSRRRSFQSCSPIDMIKTILHCDPNRQVMATLHPNETYSAEDQRALEDLLVANDRLFVRLGDAPRFLQACDYVVTQNSGVGLLGYFFEKPLILFGRSDFHHIALNVQDIGAPAAFERVQSHRPDYAAYLHWFLQEQAINAGRPEAEIRIREVLQSHGWPV